MSEKKVLKEMSVNKIVVGIIGFVLSLCALLSLLFSMFKVGGYDGASAYISGFNLISDRGTVTYKGNSETCSIYDWFYACAYFSNRDAIDGFKTPGMLFCIFQLVFAISGMLLSIGTTLFASYKKHKISMIVLACIGIFVLIVPMIISIMAVTRFNEATRYSYKITTDYYAGLIMVTLLAACMIIYVAAFEKKFAEKGVLEGATRGGNSANVNAAINENVDEILVEVLQTLKKLSDNGVLDELEYKEEKQEALLLARSGDSRKLTQKKAKYSSIEKYYNLMKEGALTEKEYNYMKNNL